MKEWKTVTEVKWGASFRGSFGPNSAWGSLGILFLYYLDGLRDRLIDRDKDRRLAGRLTGDLLLTGDGDRDIDIDLDRSLRSFFIDGDCFRDDFRDLLDFRESFFSCLTGLISDSEESDSETEFRFISRILRSFLPFLFFLSFFAFFAFFGVLISDFLPIFCHHVILSLMAIPVVPLGFSVFANSAFFSLNFSGSLER